MNHHRICQLKEAQESSVDPQALQQLVAFLAPFLPYLLKAGETAAEEAGKNLGTEGWNWAKALWQKLQPKIAGKAAAQEAAEDVAKTPNDPDAQATFRQQLKKLLADDPTLAAELTSLLGQIRPAGVNVIASGNRSVAIGGNVSGSTIITGDQNQK
ncbi:MAG TPA: hypothetical protein DEF43_17720 [Chloroflexus aurantiacus]|uniref:Uncharacterized protein n=1 Tax=Chloroflexus aurantiacus (strain ATCC 29366 / DSM 635 / J-10-fl) TaxID=324602 RepID=A9WJ48_CHLAA|nr:conserved hypothetical protein [Chloroflexus aurantiacus J-10-fl]RMG52876.1 MAG: hypothetical protein D6716_02385 [Chloroflexota bacterium]HBW68948.1 hypothetical protein [Chloroflexus aurantiacus]